MGNICEGKVRNCEETLVEENALDFNLCGRSNSLRKLSQMAAATNKAVCVKKKSHVCRSEKQIRLLYNSEM